MNPFDATLSRRALLKATGLAAAGLTVVPAFAAIRSSTVRAADATSSITNVGDLAFALAYDPNQMFRYVADQVGYDAYAGALRGPTGTLWSGAGNSVDQALLLGALFQEAAIPYRYVIGTLDPTTAAGMVVPMTVADARDRAARALLPPDVAASWSGSGSWKRTPQSDALFETAHAQAQASVQLITAALARAGVTVEAPPVAIPDLELQKHVWLQYANGAEWVDLDPTIHGAAAGTSYATNGVTSLSIPDDLYHRVTFRIDADVIQAGQLATQTLLTQTLRSADLAETPITLIHPGTDWLGLEGALEGAKRYAPLLLVGDQAFKGDAMQLRTGPGINGAFGNEGSTDGETVAEYLSVDVTTPSGVSRHATRTVFDRLTADERASGTYDFTKLPDVELTDVGKDVGTVYLPLLATTLLAVSAGPTSWSFFGTDENLPDDDLKVGSIIAHAQPMLRDLLLLDAIGDRTAPRLFADEPSVTAFASVPTDVAADGKSTIATWVDILHSHLVPGPLSDADSSVPAGMLAGAVDHAAERMIVEGGIASTPDKPADYTVASVGRVFELAAEQGIGTVVLRQGDAVAIEGAPAAALDRLRSAIAGGLVAIAPAAAVQLDGQPRLGWWLVDPGTGTTHDQMDTGRGADLFEEAYMLVHELYVASMCVVGLGLIVASVVKQSMGLFILGAAISLGFCSLAGAAHAAGH